MIKRSRVVPLIFLCTLLFIFLVYLKNNLGQPAIEEIPADAQFVYIPTNSNFEEVLKILEAQDLVQNENKFKSIAQKLGYIKNPMRSGRYMIEPGMKAEDIIKHLKGGSQAPVNVVLNNERLLEDVAAKVSRFLEPDSLALISLFHDDLYLADLGYTREDLMSLFIPNTYQLYWNTNPKDFIDRMIKEHEKFWKKQQRKQKAEDLGLSQKEVYTLASIVEKETLKDDEKQTMAGVYFNRLEENMLLQADPTAVFATRDFSTKRVLNYHTRYDSPFNTYKYKGLPPGPITMTSISSIDAVLNLEQHDYLFFCAKGDGSGYHNFAKSLEQHNKNAEIYRKNLKKRGLR
ncbi:MAG: endolytic transglycosylase MltG [Saprospiraceae bacterium]